MIRCSPLYVCLPGRRVAQGQVWSGYREVPGPGPSSLYDAVPFMYVYMGVAVKCEKLAKRKLIFIYCAHPMHITRHRAREIRQH
jgi:hypothetical protein